MSCLWLIAASAQLLLIVPSANGDGMNLAWNDCSLNGTMNRNFTCHTNFGVHAMVVSFDPPPGITKLVGCSATLELETSNPLPAWWELYPGGCREGSIRLELAAPTTLNCVDYWGAAATGTFAYTVTGSNRASITLSFGIPEAMAGAVETGTEYYAFQLILNNRNTVGPGSCAGCLDPACVHLTGLWLYQPAGMGDHLLCNSLTSNYVTWQGGSPIPCPPVDGPPGDCGVIPTARRSWGLIKGLYR